MTLSPLEAQIRFDAAAMGVLQVVRDVGPKDAFVAAGFVRNRYWDSLYDPAPQAASTDTDVIYFDSSYTLKSRDMAYEASLKIAMPEVDWQVRNQARMHAFGGYAPFSDIDDALRHWSETATAVGVRLIPDDTLNWIAPFGFDDLFDHILRITPAMKARDPSGFDARIEQKGWLKLWPNLRVVR